MKDHAYRDPVLDEPAPKGFIALIWRWILLRRADRMEREVRRLPPPPAKQTGVRTVHMVRGSYFDPYTPETIILPKCPGKTAQRPEDINAHGVNDYWLCTPEHCCCEVVE